MIINGGKLAGAGTHTTCNDACFDRGSDLRAAIPLHIDILTAKLYTQVYILRFRRDVEARSHPVEDPSRESPACLTPPINKCLASSRDLVWY